ncbi:MAG: exonuclease domain-containing protein, partial [Clostridia bacterium]
MNYIVLDMEWNQSYPKEGEDIRKKKPLNEIIEIGAVKLDENMRCLATYKRLIKPVFIKKLNAHVKKLTGITSQMLARGSYFPEIIEEFKEWCGEDRVILTWGYDDIPMLISCLKMYGMETEWVGKWYNLQVIFNAQTDSGTNQKSLKSAMEYFNCSIDEEHPWHDALNDAEYTAMICRNLDLEKGIRDYAEHTRAMSPSAMVFMNLKEVARRQYRCTTVNGRSQCPEAFNNNACPVCGAPMVRGKWVEQNRGKLVTIAECRTHGRFFIQIRLVK